METLKLIFALLSLAVVTGCMEFETPLQEVNYNIEKDKFINELIMTAPISRTVDTNDYVHYVLYKFTWESYRITVFHYLQTPYYQTESWDYLGHYKDGRMLIINSYSDVKAHKIAPETYIKLHNLCLQN